MSGVAALIVAAQTATPGASLGPPKAKRNTFTLDEPVQVPATPHPTSAPPSPPPSEKPPGYFESSSTHLSAQDAVAIILEKAQIGLQEHHRHVMALVSTQVSEVLPLRAANLAYQAKLKVAPLDSSLLTKTSSAPIPGTISEEAQPELDANSSEGIDGSQLICAHESREGDHVARLPSKLANSRATLLSPHDVPTRVGSQSSAVSVPESTNDPRSASDVHSRLFADTSLRHVSASLELFGSSIGTLRDAATTREQPTKCDHCGNIFMADSVFCRQCGHRRVPEKTDLERSLTCTHKREHRGFKVLPAWHHHRTRHHQEQAQEMLDKLHRGTQKMVSTNSESRAFSSSRTNISLTSGISDVESSDSGSSTASATVVPERQQDGVKWYTLYPYSFRRGLWDVASLILVLYDAIVLPLGFFDPPETTFQKTCDWIARIFWTFDMPASCLTGYVAIDGSIQMIEKLIIKRYLRTWFLLDAIVVGVDWVEVFAISAAGVEYARVGKVTRTFRIVRMIRLLRIARMREVLDMLTERFNSQRILVFSDISKLIFIILGLAHLVACIWFGIGNGCGTPPRTWVDKYEWKHRPLGDQYAMSLHWSISQFTGGMDEITPENPGERIYAMFCLIIAFIIASFFVSSLTSSMTELQLLGSSDAKKISLLRAYLHLHSISSKIAMRVTRNAHHSLREQNRNVPEDQIELLKLVSEPLRMELHFEIFSRVLKVHPFFYHYIEECPQVMRRVCHLASTFIDLSAGDILFSTGEVPTNPKMYFVCVGTLQYASHNFVSQDKHRFDVGVGQWLAEGVLWTTWMHRGELRATSNCRLATLDSQKFQELAGEFHHHGSVDPKLYAEMFVKYLTKCIAKGEDFNDLANFTGFDNTGTINMRSSQESISFSQHHSTALHSLTTPTRQAVKNIIQLLRD